MSALSTVFPLYQPDSSHPIYLLSPHLNAHHNSYCSTFLLRYHIIPVVLSCITFPYYLPIPYHSLTLHTFPYTLPIPYPLLPYIYSALHFSILFSYESLSLSLFSPYHPCSLIMYCIYLLSPHPLSFSCSTYISLHSPHPIPSPTILYSALFLFYSHTPYLSSPTIIYTIFPFLPCPTFLFSFAHRSCPPTFIYSLQSPIHCYTSP